jgi:hypothetical protein
MHRQRWLQYIGVSALAAAAMFINPFGIQTLLVPIVVLNSPSSIDLINEWQPPNLLEGQGLVLLLILVLLAAAWAVQIIQRRPDWTHILTSAALAYMTLKYERSLAFFAIVAAPVLISEIGCWVDQQKSGKYFARLFGLLRRRVVPYGYSVLGGVMIGAIAYAGLRLSPDFMRQWTAQHLPVYAVETLLEERPAANVFNHYDWGGYVLWYAQDYPILIDGRSDLYTDFVFEWLAVARGVEWEEAFSQWGINTVLMKPDDEIVRQLRQHAEWEILYEDSRTVLMTRTQPVPR